LTNSLIGTIIEITARESNQQNIISTENIVKEYFSYFGTIGYNAFGEFEAFKRENNNNNNLSSPSLPPPEFGGT